MEIAQHPQVPSEGLCLVWLSTAEVWDLSAATPLSPGCISHLITAVHLVWAVYSPPEENSHLINFRFKATRSPYIKKGVGGEQLVN